MSQYLLATYQVEGKVPGSPTTPEEMQAFMQRVTTLEEEMDANGTFVFSGALNSPEAATVVKKGNSDVVVTDGTFSSSKEHIAGFYVIDAKDHDEALDWAARVTDATNHPIEVREFRHAGRTKA
jgi:hypothetical protein